MRISAIILLISIVIFVGGCSASLSRTEIQELVQIELASSLERLTPNLVGVPLEKSGLLVHGALRVQGARQGFRESKVKKDLVGNEVHRA